MFEIFKATDPLYQDKVNSIKEIILAECNAEVAEAKEMDRYIYWSRPEWQSEGGAVLEYDEALKHYRLMHIAFYMEDDTVYALGKYQNDYIYDKLIREFYQGIYYKFQEACQGHNHMLVQLHNHEIEDSIWVGNWPYIDHRSTDHPDYQEGIVDIGDVGVIMHFHNPDNRGHIGLAC